MNLFRDFGRDNYFILNMVIKNQSFGNFIREDQTELRFVDFLDWNFNRIDRTLVDDLLTGVSPERGDRCDEGGGNFLSLIHHDEGEPLAVRVVAEELVEEHVVIVIGNS